MTDSPPRPDPDALLKKVQADDARAAHPKLKVFFGFAPGVGKTYAMLASARRLRDQGVDVAVGVVETHGRPDTEALAAGLETIPRRLREHRGTSLEEFDLDVALARRPEVLLVDELAHTNAPGSRHPKRFQDVLELLGSGIGVHTTLNVQHVESLNDVVAQITGVRVRETVPDAILDRADEIELIDIPPEELLARLSAGKVYLPAQASRALEHFFGRGNLLALRELALRRTADRVDADVLAYREQHEIRSTWATAERILVAVGPSPGSARLVRAARRMAAGLRAPWTAAYVDSAGDDALDPEARARLETNLRLAESLGGEVVRLGGTRIGDALLDFARRRNVTRLIVGKPTRWSLRDRLRGSLVDEIVRASGEIDVHVISGDAAPDEARTIATRLPAAIPPRPSGYLWAGLLVSLATGLGIAAGGGLARTDIAMLYLLAIMLVAYLGARAPAVFAAALSVGCYNFFFIPPYFTFAVSDSQHLITFAMMFVVGLLMSWVTLRIRAQEEHARARELHTQALYALARDLAAAQDATQASSTLCRHAAATFDCGAALMLVDPSGGLVTEATEGGIDLGPQDDAVARWSLDHAAPAGRGTTTLPGSRVLCLPVSASASPLGVLAISFPADRDLLIQERHLLESFLRQAAVALERARLAGEAEAASLRARTEEMRNALLSAVSHDLRTPLAAITGAATSLRDRGSELAPEARRELLGTVCDEAEMLETLVRNLLDITRLQAGAVELRKDWIPLDEAVGGAVSRVEKLLAGRPLEIALPDPIPMVRVDPVLFGQVLVNLLENACKYTPAGAPVSIRARFETGRMVLDVADRGPGLPPGGEERIFEKFYRRAPAGVPGVGLGLPICRAAMHAHGGTIEAMNREGGGSVFRLVLPREEGAPPALPESP